MMISKLHMCRKKSDRHFFHIKYNFRQKIILLNLISIFKIPLRNHIDIILVCNIDISAGIHPHTFLAPLAQRNCLRKS